MAQTQADAVLTWTNVTLQAIQRDVTDPPVATRILAIESLAVYDTLAAIQGTPAFLVQSTGHSYGLPVHIFRGMGHAVTHEKDWPLVAATLREWLDTLAA